MKYSRTTLHQHTNTLLWKRMLTILVGCLALMTTLGAQVGYGQEPNDPEAELIAANSQLRQFAAVEMVEASELFFNNIPLQLDNVTVLSRNDVLALSANVDGVNRLKLNDLRDGEKIGLIFFAPSGGTPAVRPGLYLVKAYLQLHGNESQIQEQGLLPQLRIGRVELIDKTGNVAATFPLLVTETRPTVAAPILPVHTIDLQVNTLGINIHWNSSPTKSLNLYYAIPLRR